VEVAFVVSTPEDGTPENPAMLVLTRRLSQEIVIADNIRITIVAVSGNSVRIGITAPRGRFSSER